MYAFVEVTAEQVAEELRSGYSLRVLEKTLPGSPRNREVGQALDQLVAWKLAARLANGKISVLLKKLKPNTIEFFYRRVAQDRLHRPASGSKKYKQGDLFGV